MTPLSHAVTLAASENGLLEGKNGSHAGVISAGLPGEPAEFCRSPGARIG
jgi:hypothetical protein